MTATQQLITVAHASPVAIQSAPTPGPVVQAPAAHASSAQAPPISTHPSARNRYATRGRSGLSRRARPWQREFAATVMNASMTASGSIAKNTAWIGWR